MPASRIFPILLLGALALAALIHGLMGRKNETLDGVIVQDFDAYEFYPGAKDCNHRSTPYALLPNARFYEIVRSSVPIGHLERSLHATWKAKLNGNLSHVGWFKYRHVGADPVVADKTYWREISVNYVVDAMLLDCRDTR